MASHLLWCKSARDAYVGPKENCSTSPMLTAPVSETATGSASQPGGLRRAGVHAPVGYDAVYAEGASGPSGVVLRHGREVGVILSFVFLQVMCATCTKQAGSKVACIEEASKEQGGVSHAVTSVQILSTFTSITC